MFKDQDSYKQTKKKTYEGFADEQGNLIYDVKKKLKRHTYIHIHTYLKSFKDDQCLGKSKQTNNMDGLTISVNEEYAIEIAKSKIDLYSWGIICYSNLNTEL